VASPQSGRPGRTLLVLLVALIGLLGWTWWPGLSHAPRLGLDLRGGTQVILTPSLANGQAGNITQDALNQTVSIIEQRVNGLGVAEATVSLQGNGSNAAIVVSVPGVNQQQIANTLKQTALLDFRPVYAETASTVTNPSATPSASPKQSWVATPSTPPTSTATPTPTASVTSSPTPSASGSATPGPKVPIMSDTNDATLQAAFASLDCRNAANRPGGVPDNPTKWAVTCSTDGNLKYLLEPAFIKGTNVTNAQAALPQSGGGGTWIVNLTFDDAGAKALATVSTSLVSKQSPQNQFAIVLDGLVVESPFFQSAILGGQAEISGTFSVDQAKSLANVLKYGALPLTLNIGEVTTVSPTIGSDQLGAGLLAGAIGLILVVLYLLFYYRALGLVAIASLIIAAIISFGTFVVLGRTIGFTFTLAGVAGAIVAIGITADSFVVYFERIRDEIRDGKSLRAGVDSAWLRARRTILAADFVSILAAVVLYYLSVGSVRGFAFTLGLTTLVDILVAFTFTRPLVVLVARNNWFASGAAMTGLAPTRLGVASLAAPPRKPRATSREA
jgi:preprotein translocase subunit SecD